MSRSTDYFCASKAPGSRVRLIVRLAVVFVGCAWIAGTVWAVSVLPVVESHGFRWSHVESAVAGAAMCVALVLVALAYRQGGPPFNLPALVIVAAAWAAIASEVLMNATDALAVVAAIFGCGLVRRTYRGAPAGGALLGSATGLSPLLLAGAVPMLGGRSRRHPASGRWAWTQFVAVCGLTLGALHLLGLGAWAGVLPAAILERVGPPAVWRQLSDWITLMLPVLCLGLLAAIADDRDAFDSRSGLRIWVWINVAAALVFPKVVLSHAFVFAAPFSLLAADGWRVLRNLAAPSSPPFARLVGIAAMLLLFAMTLAALAAAARTILPAMVGP